MTTPDALRFSLKALLAHRLRSLLSLLGMAIGVAAVVILTALGEGARLYVVGEFANIGTNLLGFVRRFTVELAFNRFIWKRGRLRWAAHWFILWGTLTAAAITFPLVFGWIYFDTLPDDLSWYRVYVFGIPTFADTPRSEVYFADTVDSVGPLGAKAQGECAINAVAPAIANAVADATGIRFADLPLTPDRIFERLGFLHGPPPKSYG